MSSMTRWEPFRGLNALQEQVNRLFEDSFARSRSSQVELASWAPAVDIFEAENELVTIRGEGKFSNELSAR
jgi:HSP20 family molecular chaperone IbpA